MRTAEDILRDFGISLRSTAPGRHYATCPQCSVNAKHAANRRRRSLGVTIDAGGVGFRCLNCDLSGGKFFSDDSQSKGNRVAGKPGDRGGNRVTYADLQKQARAAWR